MGRHFKKYGAALLAAALLFSRAGALAALLPPTADKRFTAAYNNALLSKVLNSFTIFTTGAGWIYQTVTSLCLGKGAVQTVFGNTI